MGTFEFLFISMGKHHKKHKHHKKDKKEKIKSYQLIKEDHAKGWVPSCFAHHAVVANLENGKKRLVDFHANGKIEVKKSKEAERRMKEAKHVGTIHQPPKTVSFQTLVANKREKYENNYGAFRNCQDYAGTQMKLLGGK